MDNRVPVPTEISQAFTEIAQSNRLTWHMVEGCGDPAKGSNFDQVNAVYPFEKVSDRARHYVTAALQHMLMWADHAAPFKFHPEQTVTFTLRPSYTLARAALESAAQAVWLMDTRDPIVCVQRHLQLIRWDLQEHRKSHLDTAGKERIKARETELLRRVAALFTDDQLKPPPSYLNVIRDACNPDDLDLDKDDVERVWRAASGAAHGMYGERVTSVGPLREWLEVTEVHEGRVVFDAHNLFPNGEDRVYTNTLFFRTAEEFTQALDSAGFTDVAVCGDWQGIPVEDSSRFLLFRAHRAHA
jgi:hypothetical protein